MHHLLIKYLNASILGFCLLLALTAAFLWLCRPSHIQEIEPEAIKASLPKGAFSQTPEAYANIREPALSLKYTPPSLHIPDLRNVLVYNGKNGRPDASVDKPSFHFSLAGGKNNTSITPGEKLYLAFNKKNEGSKYAFSPRNEESSLWIEAEPSNQEVIVHVHMLDEDGSEITEPSALKSFALAEKEFIRNMSTPWEMGKWRVDATLLARQKARWYGLDRFLEEHGGDEYKDISGKQRIDFGEGADLYSIFVKAGDSLVYTNEKWHIVTPSDESLNHPLLVVKKIDDRLMNLELWDVQGKGKVVLNLLKSSENFVQNNLEQSFKFLGARTRSQFLFEIDNERMTVRPHDWLILTESGWKKISSVDEVDDYVNRKLTGTLFVFDQIVRNNDKQVMKATVYNANRTEAFPVEIAMQSTNLSPKAPAGEEDLENPVPKAQEAFAKKAPRVPAPSYARKEAYNSLED